MRPPRCHYSRLSQATSHSIHFSKRFYSSEYLYCHDRAQVILEGVEIPPNVYTFLR